MTKVELLERVREAHGALTSALAGLNEEEAGRTGLNPQWSVKDALAHITAWELEAVRLIEDLRAGRGALPSFDNEAIDGFNAAAVAERRGRTFADLREEFDAAHRRLTELLESLPDDLDESSREFRSAEVLTVRHHTRHAAQIEEWRKKLREP